MPIYTEIVPWPGGLLDLSKFLISCLTGKLKSHVFIARLSSGLSVCSKVSLSNLPIDPVKLVGWKPWNLKSCYHQVFIKSFHAISVLWYKGNRLYLTLSWFVCTYLHGLFVLIILSLIDSLSLEKGNCCHGFENVLIFRNLDHDSNAYRFDKQTDYCFNTDIFNFYLYNCTVTVVTFQGWWSM